MTGIDRIADLLRRCTPAAQDSNHARIRKFEFREDLLEPGQDLAPAQRKVDLAASWRRGDKFLSAALRLGIPASRVRRDLAEIRSSLRARGHAIGRKFSNFEACQLFLQECARPAGDEVADHEVGDSGGDEPLPTRPRMNRVQLTAIPRLIHQVQDRRRAPPPPPADAATFAAILLF